MDVGFYGFNLRRCILFEKSMLGFLEEDFNLDWVTKVHPINADAIFRKA